MASRIVLVVAWLGLSATAACYFTPNGGNGTGSTGSTLDCTKRQGGDAPLRRLSRVEYDNTMRDLLGDTSQVAQKSFPADPRVNGYDNNADVLNVSDPLAQAYLDAAETVATTAVGNLPGLMGCDPSKTPQDDCAKSFIASFGKRAYRRPLLDTESNTLFAQYQSAFTQWGLTDAVRLITETMLMSPNFLYRPELGAASADVNLVPLTSYERASRLSYLIWGSMPDAALFAAADQNELDTPEQVEAQALRMLADPKARDAVAGFHLAWLGIDGAVPQKSATLYPAYNAQIFADMREETSSLVKDVVFDGDGTLGSLIASPYTFVNTELATYYGLTPPSGSGFVKVAVDPSKRLGLLGQGSVMAAHAKPDQSSPVSRGKLVRLQFFCQPPPPPPPDVPPPPMVSSGGTTRERFAEHATNPVCASCHSLMDPIGFGFENFDATGNYRTMDQGLPVDASGDVESTDDSNGTFVGEAELATRLAKSNQVQRCYTLQLFRYAQGRTESDADACELKQVGDAFAQAGGDIKKLIVSLALSDGFLYRKAISQ